MQRLSDPNRSDFRNHKSLATAIATQKNHCDSENTLWSQLFGLGIHQFCVVFIVFQKRHIGQETPQKSLRLQGCDSESQRFFLAQCDFCDCDIASGVAPANQTKERPVHELFRGAFRNKSSMWIVLVFPRKNTRIHKNERNSWTSRFGPFFGLACRGDSWLRFYCDFFCGKSLRLWSCDCQSLAICDCDCVGHWVQR